MLTEEQLKNLKKGDKVLAEVSFSSVCKDNDLICNAPFTSGTGDIIQSGTPYHPSCLTLPPNKPKHDPCRKFKKGDIVKKRWVDGRTDVDFPFDKPCEVYSDEDMYGNIRIQTSPNFTSIIKAVFVELVTPVEDIEPYSVIDSPKTYNIVQAGKKGLIATFYKNQPLAKEGAENHCERLNAEWKWRKEHE